MKSFAGTFHQNKQGDWVKCITEGGKPCSRHSGGEHIRGADLEEALENLHADDGFGMDDDTTTTTHEREKPVITRIVYDPDDSYEKRMTDFRNEVTNVFPDFKETDISHIGGSNEDWYAMDTKSQMSIIDYTGSLYKRITARLLRGRKKVAKIDATIDSIHQGIQKCRTHEDMFVFRNILVNGSLRSVEERQYYDALEHGEDTIIRTNFTSTSASIGFSGHTGRRNNTDYVIRVPKGTPAVYIGGHSHYSGEYELLIDKDTKYRIAGICERGDIERNHSGQERWKGAAPIIMLEVVNE
jgi:hypothetical protein